MSIPAPRLRFLAARLHGLGPRPLYEFLKELDAGAPLHPRLEAYAALTPLQSFIRELRGDELPPFRIICGGKQ